MKDTETVLIGHSTDGIRFTWPNGETTYFQNAIDLADHHARVVRKMDHALTILKSVKLVKASDSMTPDTQGGNEIRNDINAIILSAAELLK